MARLSRGLSILGIAVLALLSTADAFYLPGAAPHDYQSGEKVALLVNALTPMIAGYDNAKLVRRSHSLLNAFQRSRAVVGGAEISHKPYVRRLCHTKSESVSLTLHSR